MDSSITSALAAGGVGDLAVAESGNPRRKEIFFHTLAETSSAPHPLGGLAHVASQKNTSSFPVERMMGTSRP